MKFSKILILFLFIFTAAFPLHAEDGPLPPLPQGPLLLTSVQPPMLSPDYWIAKIPNAEEPVKTSEQLQEFNKDIHAMVKDCADIFKLSATKSGKGLREFIQMQYKAVRGRGLYNLKNEVVPPAYFDANVKDNLNLEKIPDTINVKWAVAATPVRVRALPTDIKLMEKLDDPEFDMLQFTRLKTWDPVAVLHTSKDGKWIYIQSASTRGWAEASGIAVFSSRETIKKHLSKFLVVLAESVPVFKDAAMQQ